MLNDFRSERGDVRYFEKYFKELRRFEMRYGHVGATPNI